MFPVLVAMYGHGLGLDPAKHLNGDLLDLCTASECVSPARSRAAACRHTHWQLAHPRTQARRARRHSRLGRGLRYSEADAMKCIAKGHAITDYAAKREYLTALSEKLKRCPYLTCTISTPGDPVIAPGFTSPAV